MSLARISNATSALVAPAAATKGSGIMISRASMARNVSARPRLPRVVKALVDGEGAVRPAQRFVIAALERGLDAEQHERGGAIGIEAEGVVERVDRGGIVPQLAERCAEHVEDLGIAGIERGGP